MVIQEATATTAVEETTTKLEEAVIHAAEAMTFMAEVEEITQAIITEMATAIQEARQRHLLDPEEEVIKAMTEITREKVILKESQ